LQTLIALAPPELPRFGEIVMDTPVRVMAALAGVPTAVSAGLAPARVASLLFAVARRANVTSSRVL
jgi:hypothetical protein